LCFTDFFKGGEAVLDFSFSEFYSFILALLAVVLPYVTGKKDKNGNDKQEK